MYRGDAARSGVGAEAPEFPLRPKWVWSSAVPPQPAWPQPGKELHRIDFDYAFQPVLAGGKVLFGSSADNTLRCLDAATGRLLRTFEGTDLTDEIVYIDGTLVLSLNREPQRAGRTVKESKGKKTFLGLDTDPPVHKAIAAVDAETGKVEWREKVPDDKQRAQVVKTLVQEELKENRYDEDSNQVVLSRGQAAAYEVRYASVPVTESSWEQATAFEVTQAPQPAGATETIRVEGLTPETTVHLALRAVDDAALAGPVSNEVEVTLPADEVPPGAITDLQVTGTGIFTATLGWTAPGNDGEHGKAEGYEVRYAEEAITEGTWEEATAVPVSLVPKEAGEEEELTLTDLPGDRVLWFAVRATDEAGNEGAVSNGASGFVRREPRTWEIRADGSGDVATVQAGIDTASPGDEVVVYPGTYREHIDFRGKGIYLHSAEGPEGTILDGSATEGSVVIFQSGETREATLEGFTVTGGTGTVVGEGALVVGGGIYCSDSSPTIVRNHIVDNKAGFPLRGGGGGMLIDGSRDTRPFISPIVEDNVFERNRAATNGGGLVIGSADVTIARNTFLGNESIYDGGAVFVMMGEPGTARFIENEFWENVAGDHGGAIEAGQMGYGSAPLQIEGNLFVRNEAHGEDLPSDSGTGGGISMRGWAGSIVNNTFVGNVGTGGAPCTGAAILVCTESLEVFVERNIFAGSEGCAVACRFGAEGTTVRDNIFWNNLPRDVDNPRSCFPFSPAENFFVNPLFCDPAHDDYRVRSDSPALAGPNVIGAYPEPGCEP